MHIRIAASTLMIATLCVGSANGAKESELETHRDAFGQLLAEVGAAHTNQTWLQPDWQSSIPAWLDKLEDSVRSQTKRAYYKLPVKLKDVTPTAALPNRPVGLTKALLVGEDVEIGHAKDSVILATGSVTVSFAERCVIVAGGVIRVSHSDNNTLLAGHCVHVSHDGSKVPRNVRDQAVPPLKECSLFMSSGVVDIAHAGGTIVSARQRVSISHARQVCFLNVTNKRKGHEFGCESVTAFGLPFPTRTTSLNLPKDIQVTQVIERRGLFAVVKQDDFEFVWRSKKPLVDRHGKTIAQLAGWSIVHGFDDYLLFRKGTQFASVNVTLAEAPAQ